MLASRLTHAAEPTASHSTPQLIAPSPERLPARGRQATAASSLAGWLSVYIDPVHCVVGRLMDADGKPFGDPFFIAGDVNATSPRVVFDGTQFVVAWLTFGDGEGAISLTVQRLDTQGAPVGPREDLPLAPYQHLPKLSAVSGPEGVVIVLCTADDQDNTCRTWPAPASGLGSADVMVMDDAATRIDSAFSGSQLLVAIETAQSGVQLLRGTTDGALLDQMPIPLGSGAALERAAAVVATKTGFALVWADEQSERLSAVDAQGTVTTEATPLIDGTLGSPQLLALPDGFVLFGADEERWQLRRYSSTWAAQGEPTIMDDDLRLSRASLAANSGALLTLWETPARETISLQLDPSDIAIPPQRTPVSVTIPSQTSVLAAPGPGGWLVAWTEDRFVRARLLDQAGLPRGDVFTIGAASTGDRSFVAEVSGRADGWLVIWWGDDPVMQAVTVDASGVIGKKVPLDLYGRVQAVPTGNGWTVAYNQADVVQNTNTLVTRYLGLDGELSAATVLSEPSLSQLPFDIALSSDGYRVWWKAGISLAAVDVHAGGTTKAVLPAYQAYDWTVLSAVVNPSGSSLMWMTGLGAHHFGTTTRVETTVLDNVRAAELVRVAGTTAATWRPWGNTALTEIGLLSDAGVFVAVDSLDDALAPSLSEAAGKDLLLTFVREEELAGLPTLRAYSSLVTVTGEALGGAGGAGGAGAAGDDAGAAGETNAAGRASGASSSEPEGEAGTMRQSLRTSAGCGCRAAGTSPRSVVGLALFALLAAATRRRRAT